MTPLRYLEPCAAGNNRPPEQSDTVSEIFMRVFVQNLADDDTPTELGLRIDEALGAFLPRWPAEVLEP